MTRADGLEIGSSGLLGLLGGCFSGGFTTVGVVVMVAGVVAEVDAGIVAGGVDAGGFLTPAGLAVLSVILLPVEPLTVGFVIADC